MYALLGGSSLPGLVTDVDHAVAKAAFLQKVQLQINIVREGLFAASYHDRYEEQVALANNPALKA
jgi:hypothetical protein